VFRGALEPFIKARHWTFVSSKLKPVQDVQIVQPLPLRSSRSRKAAFDSNAKCTLA
jgi:hypothetical protein